jgi:exopolysaccharide/PEP-CTERM locus tyrosine autokinase
MQTAARSIGEPMSTPAPVARVAEPRAKVIVPDVNETPRAAGPRIRTDKMVRVDRQGLRAQELLPPEHHERALADQYRQIKRPLIANATGRGTEKLRNGQLIMMASAMPGEGKTFTSINLALSMAMEKDISVVLIDADVAKPHVSRIFGVENEPGLMDVLRDESLDLDSVTLPTDVPGLLIVPAGRRTEGATELLASQRMDLVMRQMAESNPMQIALLDSPPLLLTSESRAVAQVVGQVVLVVRAGFTPQQAVLDAISYVGEGKTMGLVLNQSTAGGTSGYYYGYGDADNGPQ